MSTGKPAFGWISERETAEEWRQMAWRNSERKQLLAGPVVATVHVFFAATKKTVK